MDSKLYDNNVLHTDKTNMVYSFLRIIYKKIIPKNIREKLKHNIHRKKQHEFNINFCKRLLSFIQYLDKNTSFLINEDITLIKNNLITIKSLYKKYKLIRTLEIERKSCKEYEKILNYLFKNPITMLPYDFYNKYNYNDIVVFNDNGNKYVLYENKRMYFPKIWENERIQKYYNGIIYEQDIDSPHRYESDIVHVNPGDVVVDIGASEGFFALSVIESAKKVYLFECDEIWNDAQKMTFEPYKDKVVIVNKFVSDNTNDNNITLDQFFDEQEVNFIKADIEGAEIKALNGCYNLFKTNKNIKVAFCTYHNKNDAEEIKQILIKNNFQIEFSKGYIISVWEESFNLRKGVIRAYK